MKQENQKINQGKKIRTKGNSVFIAKGYSKDSKVFELALEKLQDIYGDKANSKRSKRNQIN